MSEFRINFLNWRPDQDEFNTDGLQVAENVLHETEGYKQLLKQTAGSFSTETAPFTMSSVRAIQVRQIIGANTRIYNVIRDFPTTAALAYIEMHTENDLSPASITTATLASSSAVRIESFSVAEFEQGGVATCKVRASLQAGGATTYSLSRDFGFTVTSF